MEFFFFMGEDACLSPPMLSPLRALVIAKTCSHPCRGQCGCGSHLPLCVGTAGAAATGDGRLICELGGVVEVGERRSPEGGQGVWWGLRRGRLGIGRGG